MKLSSCSLLFSISLKVSNFLCTTMFNLKTKRINILINKLSDWSKAWIQKQRAMNDGIQQTHRCTSNIRKKVFISTKKIRCKVSLRNFKKLKWDGCFFIQVCASAIQSAPLRCSMRCLLSASGSLQSAECIKTSKSRCTTCTFTLGIYAPAGNLHHNLRRNWRGPP